MSYAPKKPMNPIPLFILLALLIAIMAPSKVGADVFRDTKLIRVIDGDTVHVQIKVWPSTIIDTKLRIYGIDTPELRTKCPKEKEMALKAKEFTENMLKNGFSVGLGKDGKYAGRSIGTIHIPLDVIKPQYTSQKSARAYFETGIEPSLGDALIKAGLARPYFGGKRFDWTGYYCPLMSENPVVPNIVIPKGEGFEQ